MGIGELLVRVVASERCGGQRLGLVEACVEFLYGAGWCVLWCGGGPVELRQERESFLVQWPSCGEVRLDCGVKGSACNGSDRFVITTLLSVRLSPELKFATMYVVESAELW